MGTSEIPPRSRGDILDGWKEISAYLGRDARTCQRWESDFGLPVHRIDPLSNLPIRDRGAPGSRGRPRGASFARRCAARDRLRAAGTTVLGIRRAADGIYKRAGCTQPDVDAC